MTRHLERWIGRLKKTSTHIRSRLPQQASDGTRYPLGYNPRLDGIRAVAAICVVFKHFDVPGFQNGRFGVDVFFVLSGYLITRILARDYDPIMQAVFPKPIVIETYDPHILKRGETFNIQPDGESWMWMQLSHVNPQNTHIRIGIWDLKTNTQGKAVSALLPKDLREHVGEESVALIGPDGKILAPPVSFEVTE